MVRPHAAPFLERIVQSWDTANKPSELADYSVATTWGITNERIHLLDLYRERLDYPELKKAVKALNERFHPDTILKTKRPGRSWHKNCATNGCGPCSRSHPKATRSCG